MSEQEELFNTKVVPAAGEVEKWRNSLVDLLKNLDNASPSEWVDETFQHELWDSQAVSNTGSGTVSVAQAVASQAFREWFGSTASHVRQLAGEDQVNELKGLHDELYTEFHKLGLKRMPRLKVNRVLAALAPERLTTLSDPGTHERMYRWVTGKSPSRVHPIDQQLEIRHAFDKLAQPFPQLQDPAHLTMFMLPWIASEELKKARERAKAASISKVAPTRGAAPIAPAKTFIAVGGGIRRLLEICDLVEPAPLSAEDLYESLEELYPWNRSWTKSVVQFLTNSLGILTREDDTYQLSMLGQEFQDTRAGNVLAERLVRHFVGVDHVLSALRDGPTPKSALVALFRSIHPNAKTDYLPNTMLTWLAAFDVVDSRSGEYSLTQTGHEWAALIQWTPSGPVIDADALPEGAELTAIEMDVPAWRLVKAQFVASATAGGMTFPEKKAFEMHVGLWSHDVRHFCILKGLSGAGKTQMAVRYAKAVIEAAGEDESCLEIIPVQPDWAEPSHLLGFTHPLDSTRYQSTQFLKILLRAHENPTKPHFVILDEMNLAHPELYLAPILSAMETESELWLHQLTEVPEHGIPGAIRYPRNLAIIGTINIDETTHNLSDKVKDRAEIIDFSEVALADFSWSRFVHLGERLTVMQSVLTSLHDALKPVRLHFGFRVVSSIVGRVAFAIDQIEGELEDWVTLFDDAVASKVLPKFRGEDTPELRTAITSVWDVLSQHKLTKSADQVDVFRRDMARDGALKYWR